MVADVFLLAHVAGAFYLTRDAPDRRPLFDALGKALLYTGCLAGVTALFLPPAEILRALPLWLIAGLWQGATAWIGLPARGRPLAFLARQGLPAVFLLLGASALGLSVQMGLWPSFLTAALADYGRPALAALLCGWPAALWVRYAIAAFQKEMPSPPDDKRTGAYIGILEREIILLLGLLGQFGAVGFVLTAKSLARFRQLEDRAFAETYLIGTLFSAAIALFCTIFLQ